MSGVYGWFGQPVGDARTILARMVATDTFSDRASADTLMAAANDLAARGPRGTVLVYEEDGVRLATFGHPSTKGAPCVSSPDNDVARRFLEDYRKRGPDALVSLQGDFSLALFDERQNRALLAIDRIGIRNVVYAIAGRVIVFGPTCDAVNAHPLWATRKIRPQSIYNYVHFHMVPGPHTMFEGVQRLEPGQSLVFDGERPAARRFWQMSFEEDHTERFEVVKQRFREALRTGVGAFVLPTGCGTFLSGGTDSSTVSGIVGEITGTPAKTFSIGFDVHGYDEMEYARIAARRFGTEHHEYYVTPADTLAALSVIADAYDEPFGNASAVPTFFCATRAHDAGITRMLAGDGGDELFGGNARYALQYQLSLYQHIPKALREIVLEPVVLNLPRSQRLTLLRRARGYVEQARKPMPSRYETYNLLDRLGADNLFDADFLRSIDRDEPSAMLADVHRAAGARSLINQLLAIDAKFTLADNDLPKVTRMCDAAGVDVAFPLLHEAVVAFSQTLPSDMKLRRTRLRYFFKEALRDFLPVEIINKSKHGFGLPAGQWLRDYAPLHEFAADALSDLRKRGIFRPEMLDALTRSWLQEHAAYYGTLVWVLMMLELWFRRHAK